MGKERNGSDIDLTIVSSNEDLHLLNQVAMALDDLLLPYTFDLSFYNQIQTKELIDHIKRVGIIFYLKKGEPQN
jgi:hypothetical protein